MITIEISMLSKHAACMPSATTKKPRWKFKKLMIQNSKTDFYSNLRKNVEMKMK